MNRRATLLLSLVLALGCAQSGTLAPTETGAVAGEPTWLARLPDHVIAPDGELSLFADFASQANDEITLYLVNRTHRTIEIPTQDGDPFAKLEIQREDGGWVRAQAHVYSDCGVSYGLLALRPRSFVAVRQWYPAGGEPATVRYAIAGEIAVASNAGQGRFDPGQRERARTDALAAQHGNVALVSEILAGESDAEAWEAMSSRRRAIQRLPELPASEATPVIVQFLDRDHVDRNEYTQAIGALHRLDPSLLADYVRTRLAGPAGPARSRVIDELPFLPSLDDAALTADLIARARVPDAAESPRAIDYLADLRTREIELLLIGIAEDPSYPDDTRLRARYQHAQWYSEDLVDLRIRPRGPYSDGHALPVWLDVEIINSGKKRIAFDYAEPHEIVELYLARSHGRDQTFLPAKPGVRWSTRPVAAAHHVELAPGETHTLAIAVAHYFDLPAQEGLVVWASVRLPGVHRIPQLAGGGAGILPRVPPR